MAERLGRKIVRGFGEGVLTGTIIEGVIASFSSILSEEAPSFNLFDALFVLGFGVIGSGVETARFAWRRRNRNQNKTSVL